MNPQGLPDWVLLAVLAIGIPLAVLRPVIANQLALAGILHADTRQFVFTRLQQLGPYLNLLDALVILYFLSSLFGSTAIRRRLSIPGAIFASVIALSAVYGVSQSTSSYDALRQAKYAIMFPALWISACWSVRSRDTARASVVIVLIACAVQSIRQMTFVEALDARHPVEWRTLQYISAGLPLLSLVALMFSQPGERVFRALALIGVPLGLVALILNQTRSLWIAQAIAGLGLLVYAAYIGRRTQAIFCCALLAIAIASADLYTFLSQKEVQPVDLFLSGRAMNFADPSGRDVAAETEFTAWLSGNVLIGGGIGYESGPEYVDMAEVAWGHVGYVAYLSNLGLVGFLMYAVFLPVYAIRIANAAIHQIGGEAVVLGAMLASMVIFAVAASGMTAGLLAGHTYMHYAILLGVAEGVTLAGRRLRANATTRVPHESFIVPKGVQLQKPEPVNCEAPTGEKSR